MNARFRFVSVAALVLGSSASWAATPVDAPSLGQQFLHHVKVGTLAQVEYCMRNMPEIRNAQSLGPDRLCVGMLLHLHNATGESLAREYEGSFRSLAEKLDQSH